MQNFVSYLRISNNKSGGADSCGVESQRQGIARYLETINGQIVQEFVEVMSGGRNDRPKLLEALKLCKQTGAKLVIFKLDRLSRSVAMIANLQEAKVPFVIATFPEANELTIGFLALMAQYERRQISERTKAGLAIVRQRGIKKLGNPSPHASLTRGHATQVANKIEHAKTIYGVLKGIQETGVTRLQELADCLNRRGYQTPRNAVFTPTAVSRVIRTCEALTLPICQTDTKTFNNEAYLNEI